MEHHAGLLDRSDHVAALDLVAHLGHGGEGPLLLPAQGRDLDSAGDVGARLVHDLLQRTLDTVVDIFNEAGPQLHRQGGAGGNHLGARPQTGGLLVDLDGGGIPVHIQDLADQTLFAHADHVGHVGVFHPGGYHQRTGNLNNFAHSVSTFFQGRFQTHCLSAGEDFSAAAFYRISAPTARSTALFTLAIPIPREPSFPGMRMIAGVSSSL